jgi:hypothetical protein
MIATGKYLARRLHVTFVMAKKKGRLLKAKTIRKALTRNSAAIGAVAAIGGVAAAVMNPTVRARTRQLKDSLVQRLGRRNKDSNPELQNGRVTHASS